MYCINTVQRIAIIAQQAAACAFILSADFLDRLGLSAQT